MDFQEYLKALPLLHTWDRGVTWKVGGFSAETLAVLHRLAGGTQGGKYIIETGAGNSTLTFLFTKPAKLITIAPSAELFGRITEFCGRAGLDTRVLQPIVERSEIALPFIARDEYDAGRRYDLALIDGSHGWPAVFVDFCYANAVLRRGGFLVVDDIQLHSCKELARLLVKQPEFRLVEDLGKMLAFEKLTDAQYLDEHGTQPYIQALTKTYAATANPFAL